jgi:hypothetical protein
MEFIKRGEKNCFGVYTQGVYATLESSSTDRLSLLLKTCGIKQFGNFHEEFSSVKIIK